MSPTLYIGNKNYSSWSLRPWLLLRAKGINFTEVLVSLYTEDGKQVLRQVSPSGKVPVLHVGELRIWESLAICEYMAEAFPYAGIWPADATARAVARCVVSEMHAGFATLRSRLPMNCKARMSYSRIDAELQADIDRTLSIWRDCRARFGSGGAFLFGEFSAADAMFAPVVLRFESYGIRVDEGGRRYMDAVLALPAMQEWLAAAHAESEHVPHYDVQP